MHFAELRDDVIEEQIVTLCPCMRLELAWTGCITCGRPASGLCVVTLQNVLVFACAEHATEMATKLRDRLSNVAPPVARLDVYACGCCGKHAWHSPKLCAGCLGAHYCDKVCQRRAWPQHREACLARRRTLVDQS